MPRLVLLDPAILLPGHVALAAAENARLDRSYVSFDELIDHRYVESQLDFAPRELVVEDLAAHVDTGDDGRLRYRYCQSAVVAAYGEMASQPPPFEDVRIPTLLVLGERSYLPYDHLLDAHRAAIGDLLDVVVVPGGHTVLWDALEETTAAISVPRALAAERGRDGRVDLDAVLEGSDVDPLDFRVQALAARSEEHRRDAGGGEERRVGPERDADHLRLGARGPSQRTGERVDTMSASGSTSNGSRDASDRTTARSRGRTPSASSRIPWISSTACSTPLPRNRPALGLEHTASRVARVLLTSLDERRVRAATSQKRVRRVRAQPAVELLDPDEDTAHLRDRVDAELRPRSVRRPADRLDLEVDEPAVCDRELHLRRLRHDRGVGRDRGGDRLRPDARDLLVGDRRQDQDRRAARAASPRPP